MQRMLTSEDHPTEPPAFATGRQQRDRSSAPAASDSAERSALPLNRHGDSFPTDAFPRERWRSRTHLVNGVAHAKAFPARLPAGSNSMGRRSPKNVFRMRRGTASMTASRSP